MPNCGRIRKPLLTPRSAGAVATNIEITKAVLRAPLERIVRPSAFTGIYLLLGDPDRQLLSMPESGNYEHQSLR